MKKLTDMQIALELKYHLDFPCGKDCIDNYVIMAERAMQTFENPFAIKLLKNTIRKYKLPKKYDSSK
jgi:hypothetical protein